MKGEVCHDAVIQNPGFAGLCPGSAQAAIHDSGLPYASVSYQADGGTNYILAYNHKTNYGRYVVMSESENVY
ncbi:MAG: hypothetical protein IJU00_03850 [Selenomonas sp.]|nr:hypothetical protein [Selenomonas sp.]